MNKHQLQLAALTLAVLLTVLLTGCGKDDERGDPGKVTGRDKDYSSATKTWDYDLTIRRADGTEYELDVSRRGYDRCYRGSSYPTCVDR